MALTDLAPWHGAPPGGAIFPLVRLSFLFACSYRYAVILKRVRDGYFEKQLHELLELVEQEKQGAIALTEANVTNSLQKAAAAKDAEIQAQKAQLDAGEMARRAKSAVT